MQHLIYPATPSTGNVSILDSGSFCQAYDAARHLARRDFSALSSSTSLLTFFCTLPPSPLFTSALLAFTSARVVVCALKVLYCRSYTLLASLTTLCTSFRSVGSMSVATPRVSSVTVISAITSAFIWSVNHAGTRLGVMYTVITKKN